MKNSPETEHCIKNCTDCYRKCLETKNYCLEMGGEHAKPEHIQALSDCMELCKISAHFMIKGSKMHPDVCNVCADACAVCAQSCEQFPDDEQMDQCAKLCRICEESCREMSRK